MSKNRRSESRWQRERISHEESVLGKRWKNVTASTDPSARKKPRTVHRDNLGRTGTRRARRQVIPSSYGTRSHKDNAVANHAQVSWSISLLVAGFKYHNVATWSFLMWIIETYRQRCRLVTNYQQIINLTLLWQIFNPLEYYYHACRGGWCWCYYVFICTMFHIYFPCYYSRVYHTMWHIGAVIIVLVWLIDFIIYSCYKLKQLELVKERQDFKPSWWSNHV